MLSDILWSWALIGVGLCKYIIDGCWWKAQYAEFRGTGSNGKTKKRCSRILTAELVLKLRGSCIRADCWSSNGRACQYPSQCNYVKWERSVFYLCFIFDVFTDIVFIGPTGSGKSSLIGSLYRAVNEVDTFPELLQRTLNHPDKDSHGTMCWLETYGNTKRTIVYQDTRGDQASTCSKL